jgi:probable phosphoglycerate mutase
LILIRHGQTPSNVLGLLDTAPPGPGLTALGAEQAAAIPQALDGQRVDALFASTLTRTRLTAAPLARARGLEVSIREGIREVAAGELEMRGDPEAVHAYLGVVRAWLDDRVDIRMPGPGGESAVEVLGRFDSVVAEAASTIPSGGTAVLVSHGAAIRIWASARAGNLPNTFGALNNLHNTGMVVLRGDPEAGWTAVSWTGAAIGGPALDDPGESGPGGEAPDGAGLDGDVPDGAGLGGAAPDGRPAIPSELGRDTEVVGGMPAGRPSPDEAG